MLHQKIQGLNPAQAQVVYHDCQTHGPLLVLAGAGSGKTTVLTLRVAHQIAQGVPAHTLFCITFTVKAAHEMRGRIHTLLQDSLESPWIGTFHALAYHILRCDFQTIPNWFRLGWTQEPQCWDSSEQWRKALVSELQKHPQWQDLDPESIDALLGESNPSAPMELDQWNALQQWHHNWQKSQNRIALSDLLPSVLQLFDQEPEILLHWQNQVGQLLVDEYQDIDPQQYAFCQKLLGQNRQWVVVGDDDQAIYGFRGADPSCLLRFQDSFTQSTMIKLEQNYRSHQAILDVANRIFQDKAPHLRKVLRGCGIQSSLRPVQVRHFATSLDEGAWIARTLRRLNSQGHAWSDFTLLCRYNRLRLYYEQVLHYWQIPLASEGSQGVQVMTLHGSKGLEFPFVFYVGLSDQLSPGKDEDPEEEKRLFYVGCTRAIQGLFLLHSRQRVYKDKIQGFAPSPFLIYARIPWYQTLWHKLWHSSDLLT